MERSFAWLEKNVGTAEELEVKARHQPAVIHLAFLVLLPRRP
ncbi:hypothetical protein [Candidatus Nitrotoga sp. HW29]|nr:hypothetical protein [Candidatus Nitrotoga sp. HW29]